MLPTNDPVPHADRAATQLRPDGSEVIEVVREEVEIGKREVITGEVRIDKTVSIEEVTLDLERVDHHIDIERRAVNEVFETRPPDVRTEGDLTIYTVVREVPVLVTHYEVVEELVLRQRRDVTVTPTVIPVHTEHVDVTRTEQEVDDPLAL